MGTKYQQPMVRKADHRTTKDIVLAFSFSLENLFDSVGAAAIW
jgi:hypothetical protein